jgi:hypothetical protein
MIGMNIYYDAPGIYILIWSLALSAMVVGPAIYQHVIQPEKLQHLKSIKSWAIPYVFSTAIFILTCFLINIESSSVKEDLVLGIFFAYFTYPVVLIIYESRNIFSGILSGYRQDSSFVSGIVSGFFPCLLTCLIFFSIYFYLRGYSFSVFFQKYSFQFFITFGINVLFFAARPRRKRGQVNI